MKPIIWTDDRVAHLTKLHGEGLSCMQIARTMGGTTRNAVIGKIFRMGLQSSRPKAVPKPRKAPARIRTERTRIISANGNSNAMRILKTVVFAPMKLRCVEIVPRHVCLTDLEPNDCRYPYGDEALTFCGHPKQAGSSYCAPHHDLCWVKPKPQKDKYLRAGA